MRKSRRDPREERSTRFNPEPRQRHEAQFPVEMLYRLR
jgi:hypothetical protein